MVRREISHHLWETAASTTSDEADVVFQSKIRELIKDGRAELSVRTQVPAARKKWGGACYMFYYSEEQTLHQKWL